MRTIRFCLWLLAAVCFVIALAGNSRVNWVAAGLLAASVTFLITATQALD